MNSILGRILHISFPSQCLLCPNDAKRSPYSFLCQSCWENWTLSFEPHWEQIEGELTVYTAGLFHQQLKNILHALKYRGKDYVVPALIDFALEQSLPFRPDCLVAVPSSWWRQWRRGYNHAALLAGELSERLNIPLVSGGLGRSALSRSQVGLTKRERRKNVQLGFYSRKNGTFLKGKSILLVDDLRTTGATLEVCARILYERGAQHVWGFAIARDELTPRTQGLANSIDSP